ncbi:MAG TPA: Rieske (2Fe-2S) protein [Puia sp.]|nr:Rieske (2Fe-2S) protein [Puia sp.]
MQRRQFLKSSCNFCLLAGTGFLFNELASCSTAYQIMEANIVDNAIAIPVDGFAQNPIQFVRPSGWLYDIAVQKKADNTYEALLLQCTHQNNQLVASGHGYNCSLHGSRFNQDGTVTKGPAENALKKYKTSIAENTLVIVLKP